MPQDNPENAARSTARWKKYLFLVGLGFAALLLWHFGWESIAGRISGANRASLGWMTLLILAGFWIRAWKWRYALGPGQSAVAIFFLAKVAGNWTPGRVGELSPLLLQRHRSAGLATWIAADRMLEIVFTLALGLAGVAALGLLPLPVTAGLAAAGLVLAAAAYLRRKTALLDALQTRWQDKPLPARALGLLRECQAELKLLGAKAPIIGAATALAKITDVYTVVLLCQAFGYDASFLLVCAARCAHALVSGIPVTPDATGIPFIAAAYLLHQEAGIPYETLTAALGLELLIINLVLYANFLLAAPQLRASKE